MHLLLYVCFNKILSTKYEIQTTRISRVVGEATRVANRAILPAELIFLWSFVIRTASCQNTCY